MKKVLFSIAIYVMSPAVFADDVAGQSKSAVCSACHGVNGISVSDNIPNLAGQKTEYLVNQLLSFRDEKRKNPLMNAIAAQLNDNEIDDLAGFFSNLPADAESLTGDLTNTLDPTHVMFPENYQSDYVLYSTVNREDNKQVRYLYANTIAVEGAKSGDSLPDGSAIIMEVYKAKLDAENNPVAGDDGFYVKDKVAGYGVMEKGEGWGDKIPEVLRNSNWNYAFFTIDKQHKPGINQAACLACHRPLTSGDFMFSAEALRKIAAE